MCGAAAESILLALAIKKDGDEQAILATYKSGNGRSRIESKLLGQQEDRLQKAYKTYGDLLKYWRDDAAHGVVSVINEEEAFTSMILLLRFAQFAETNWEILTKSTTGATA